MYGNSLIQFGTNSNSWPVRMGLQAAPLPAARPKMCTSVDRPSAFRRPTFCCAQQTQPKFRTGFSCWKFGSVIMSSSGLRTLVWSFCCNWYHACWDSADSDSQTFCALHIHKSLASVHSQTRCNRSVRSEFSRFCATDFCSTYWLGLEGNEDKYLRNMNRIKVFTTSLWDNSN